MRQVFFSVLGAVRVWRQGREVTVGPPQQRALLALLLARPGETVMVREMLTVLWGVNPPRSAVSQLRRNIGELRRIVEPDPLRAQLLVGEAAGHRLAVTEECVDLLRFRRRRERARAEYGRGERRSAVHEYVEGLRLWRGPAAAGIPETIRNHPVFGALDRERLAAVREATDLALLCGAADLILAELQRVADYHPLDEAVQAQLILALQATGRRAESLDVFDRMRHLLARELNVEPGPQLRSAVRQSLTPQIGGTHVRGAFPGVGRGMSHGMPGRRPTG